MGKNKDKCRDYKQKKRAEKKKKEEEQAAIQRRIDKEIEEREKYGYWSYDRLWRSKFISFEEAKINSYEVPEYVRSSYRDWCKAN